MLIVIAIIALLASILFPVFARAREKARQGSCAANLKQITLGFLQYSQDYDENPMNGTCPVGGATCSGGQSWMIGQGWAGQIYPYIKSTGVFVCPSDTTAKQSGGNYPVSYGYNENLVLGTNNGRNPSGTIASLAAPSMTILFTEGLSSTNYAITNAEVEVNPVGSSRNCVAGAASPSPVANGIFYCDGSCANNSGSAACTAGQLSDLGFLCGAIAEDTTTVVIPLTGRHSDGSNFAFFDGHVKWLKGANVSPGRNASNPNAVQANTSSTAATAAGTQGKFSGGGTPQATYSIN